MAGYKIVNIKELEDMAVKFGMSPNMEARFGRSATDAEQGGFSYQRFAPNFRQPFGHRHRDQEEFYVVLSGSGQVTLEDEARPIRQWDAIRVAPQTARAFESGDDGLELLVFGAGEAGEAEVIESFWDELGLGALLHLELAVACSLLGRMLLEPVPDDLVLCRPHLVEPLDRPRVRRLVHELRLVGRLTRDREHRVAERVERLLRLRLGRLDHQRLGHDEREVHRRRMEAVVHQPLRHVERAHAVLLLQVARAEHELVHAEPVVEKVVVVLQPREHVVRVQHRDLAHLAQARAVRAHEGVRADEDAERAAERPHLADRLRAVVVEPERARRP